MRTRVDHLRLEFVFTVVLALGLMVPSCKKTSSENPKTTPSGEVTQAPAVENPKSEQITTESSNLQTTPEPAAGDDGKLVPIPLELPKAMFVGTPQNISGVPNLKKPLGKARPPFLAPPGVSNVALEKDVISSDDEPVIGEIANITDGDKEATDLSCVELGPMLQHVTVDLDAKCDIYAVVVWHFHRQARVYYDVIVQVSDDPDFITGVTTIFNNDHDNTAGLGIGKDMNYIETNEGKLIDAKGVQGRYVRLYSRGNNANDYNHYVEVEVYGKPVK